jgi:hypothetical protein
MLVEPDGLPGDRWVNVDRLERRYRHIYPLKVFLENSRQLVVASAVGLIIAATYLLLRHAILVGASARAAPIEIQVFLVTAFASIVVVGYVSLWALTVRRFWKFGGLLALAVALAIGRYLFNTGMDVASPAADVIAMLMTAAPLSGGLLLAQITLTAACYFHLVWVLLQAAFALALVTTPDRAILRDLPSRQSSTSGFFSRFWGFPPLFKFARRSLARYAAIIVLSMTCALFFSFATVLPMILIGPLEDLPGIGEKCRSEVDCVLMQVPRVLEHFYFLFGAIGVCLLVGWVGQRLLQRLLRFSLEALQEIDSRAPVLFLRAFRDDQVPLRAPKVALFGRLLEMGRRAGTLDQLLLEEATPSGPVVGLGSPTDKRQPYGAARGYFTNETWQDAVANLAERSVFTVICIDDTAGVWWEVEHLVVRQHLSKTLFLIHPRYAGATENALILARLAQLLGGGQAAEFLQAAVPRTPRRSKVPTVIGFFHDQNCELCVLQTSTFSRFAYLMALRVFIRERGWHCKKITLVRDHEIPNKAGR